MEFIQELYNSGVKLNVKVDLDPVGAAWLTGSLFVGIVLALLLSLTVYSKYLR